MLNSAPSFATISIGTDVIRILDGSAFNLIVQSSLSSTSAVTFDVEVDDRNRFEVGYKAYGSRYHNGVFYRAGVALHDAGDNNDIYPCYLKMLCQALARASEQCEI
ncbi:MAG: hypothetical protein V7782_09780 [Psychromonas sp.]